MTARVVVALLLATAFLLPSVSATPACGADAGATAVGNFYVTSDPAVFEESNGIAGLQKVACEDENGRTRLGDRSVL